MSQNDIEKVIEHKLLTYVARVASVVALGFLSWISLQVVQIKGDTQEFLVSIHSLEARVTLLEGHFINQRGDVK